MGAPFVLNMGPIFRNCNVDPPLELQCGPTFKSYCMWDSSLEIAT